MLIRARVHPFPSRTRKLSSLLLTILGWRRPGKIGSANMEDAPATLVAGASFFPFSFYAASPCQRRRERGRLIKKQAGGRPQIQKRRGVSAIDPQRLEHRIDHGFPIALQRFMGAAGNVHPCQKILQ